MTESKSKKPSKRVVNTREAGLKAPTVYHSREAVGAKRIFQNITKEQAAAAEADLLAEMLSTQASQEAATEVPAPAVPPSVSASILVDAHHLEVVDAHQNLVDAHQVQPIGVHNKLTSAKPTTKTSKVVDAHQVKVVGVHREVVDAHQGVVDAHQKRVQSGGRPPLQTPVKKDNLTHRAKDRHAQGKVRLSLRLNSDIYNKINNFCKDIKFDKQAFIERLVTDFFAAQSGTQSLASNWWASTTSKEVGVHPALHEDMKINTTCEDIFYRYERFTGRKWTQRDDKLGFRYNNVNPLLIDIAMVLTIEKKLRGNTAREPIRSFNYFVAEIEVLLAQEQAGQLPGGLTEYHRYVMAKWNSEISKRVREKWKLGEEPAKLPFDDPKTEKPKPR
ncbi:MAG: hypothetical protein K1Y36_17390 [Blastocatellia bacterium]|nr:hypothetical protein [Blastocatellia bacterium]